MPGKYDGYVTPVAGRFEAAAGGVVLGLFETQSIAVRRVAQAVNGAVPIWLVGEDGEATEVKP